MSKTVRVAHLAATVGYRISGPIKHSKPTLILINSFMTNAELSKPQLSNEKLAEFLNIVAIEPLGHGDTRTAATETFTYWDSALLVTQVMDTLGIRKAFIGGTSQGGVIAVRTALYIPDRIVGIIPMGTMMDRESDRARKLGCWDVDAGSDAIVKETAATTASAADYVVSDAIVDAILQVSFGDKLDEEAKKTFTASMKKVYAGDVGKKKLRQSVINLRERDGLHGRLADIKAPVLWLQGTADTVFSVANAQEEIKLFTGSAKAEVKVIEGGQHLLGWTNAQEVNQAIAAFITEYNHLPNARALRESIGAVEM